MTTRLRISVVASALSLVAVARPALAVDCASWSVADKELRSAWAKGYPNEKIVTLEQNGAPDEYTKPKATGQTTIDEHGRTWEYYTKNKFCRVPAKALVQQGAGQKNFSVSAIFRKDGASSFVFEDIGVGDSTDVAQASQSAPSKDHVKELIAAYWVSQNPGTKVDTVKCSDPELKTQNSKGRWWYTTGADIYVVDENGAKEKCSNDMTTIYKGEKGKEGIDPRGDFKVYFLDKPVCN